MSHWIPEQNAEYGDQATHPQRAVEQREVDLAILGLPTRHAEIVQAHVDRGKKICRGKGARLALDQTPDIDVIPSAVDCNDLFAIGPAGNPGRVTTGFPHQARHARLFVVKPSPGPAQGLLLVGHGNIPGQRSVGCIGRKSIPGFVPNSQCHRGLRQDCADDPVSTLR